MSAIVSRQFRKNASHVRFDGLFGNGKPGRDNFVGVAGGDQPQHFDLPLRESIVSMMLSDFRGNLGWNSPFARVDGPDSVEKLLAQHALEEVAGRSSLEGTHGLRIASISSKHHNPRAGKLASDGDDSVDPALEIGPRMIDLYGRPLRERFRKHFLAGDAVRTHISVEHWKILPPVTGSRQALGLVFTTPLDWALLLQTITIESADGSVIDGQVLVDECERRWSFTPASPWVAGIYHIRVGCSLEDVCGNSITGAFDRPLRTGPDLVTEVNGSSLIFQLI